MRNLQLHSFYRLPDISGPDGARSLAASGDQRLVVVDQNNAQIAYVVGSDRVWRIDTASNGVQTLTAPDDPALDGRRIVAAEHLMLNDELSLVVDSGDLLTVDLQSGQLENVGSLNDLICRAAWSPDQEALAVLTASGRLVVLNTMYAEVQNCSLGDGGFGDGAFVSVGWGSKATQFHGTAGKAARFRNVDEADDDAAAGESMAEDERHRVDIVWRGDSELFAVYLPKHTENAQAGGEREFKVFNKDGTLQFTSEQSVALAAPIAWRPSGQWLAIPQRLTGKYVLALFEKNGLKHREIVLPFDSRTERVHRLQWSADSTVLAVETRRAVAGEERSRIYLYAIGNYHWYQKQTLEFAGCVTHFAWDPNGLEADGDRLHVVTESGEYVRYRWVWAVSASRTMTADDASVVAVIDGQQLLLTGFRGAIVPPPMCSAKVAFERHVNRVEFVCFADGHSTGNRFVAVDTDNALHLYECTSAEGRLNGARLLRTCRFSSLGQTVPLELSHFLFLSGSTVIVGTSSETDSVLALCEWPETGEELIVRQRQTIAGQLQQLSGVSMDEFAALTTEGLFRFPVNGFSANVHAFLSYPSTVDQICIARNGRDVFALKPKHWLRHNERIVAEGVTSMTLAEQYLLYTTIDRLHFVRLADGAVVGERRCERGARLVVSVPQNARTVLQMPRGNLEAVQPRVLSLCIIGRQLDAGEFRAAFDDMCKQRINLNLLVDHDPAAFGARVRDFVLAIDNAHWLNLFLSDLEQRDVSVEMYGSNYPGRIAAAGEGKIERVCELVRQTIDGLGKRSTLLLPVLTGYVKTGQMERALEIVWQLRRDEVSGSAADSDAVTAAAALTYLLYLVDVNVLYNVALGMYDFDIVRFVASKSQKDPKEYLPFLARLEQVEDVSYRRYQVDAHLKRWTRALDNLLACDVERHSAELVELCAKHALFAHALRHFEGTGRANGDCARSLASRFAGHLREAGNLRDACLMYERCGDFAQALLSARHIGDWMKCLQLSRRLGQSDDERLTLIGQLIPAMKESGQHANAAQLVVEHQRDFDQAVRILCDGHLYNDAIHMGRMHDDSLIDSIVRPQAVEHAGTLCSIIASDGQTFVEQKTRLLAVRQERAERQRRLDEDDDGFGETTGDLDMDTFSDTSSASGGSSRFSTSSRGTGKTHKSSKNRRKHERKLLSLKPGNPFEEIALIDALHTMAHKAFGHQTTVRQACKALIDLRADAEAHALQTALIELLRIVQDALPAIWTADLIVAEERSIVPEANAAPIDLAHLQRDQLYAMIKPHQRYKPDLKVLDWQFQVLKY